MAKAAIGESQLPGGVAVLSRYGPAAARFHYASATARSLKKTDHEREMDLLKEIRNDLKTLLARQGWT